MSTPVKILCALLLFVLGACGGDGPAAADENRLAGRYLLISIDDQNVPVVIQESGPRLVVRTSALDFVSSEDVDVSFTLEVDGLVSSFEDRSRYRRNGGQLTIYIIDGSDTTAVAGTVSGNDVTILDRDPGNPSAPTVRWLYRKP